MAKLNGNELWLSERTAKLIRAYQLAGDFLAFAETLFLQAEPVIRNGGLYAFPTPERGHRLLRVNFKVPDISELKFRAATFCRDLAPKNGLGDKTRDELRHGLHRISLKLERDSLRQIGEDKACLEALFLVFCQEKAKQIGLLEQERDLSRPLDAVANDQCAFPIDDVHFCGHRVYRISRWQFCKPHYYAALQPPKNVCKGTLV